MSDHDLVLRGGTVLDGAGGPGEVLDVGIDAGRIAALGAPGRLSGRDVLDADGLTVTPGFVDLHSHTDFTLADHPAADTALRQGVTTLVGGNCGFSPFPVADAEALRAQSAFLGGSLPLDWPDLAGYRTHVETSRPALNLALQVGHHALRTAVIGLDDRPATAAETARMVALLHAAADAGAVGFSSGLIYVPGRFAPRSELVALADAAGRRGLLYSTHVRDETTHVRDAVDEAISTAVAARVRLQVSHLKAMGRAAHGAAGDLLAAVRRARAGGLDVAADVYPYTASSTTLATRLPSWALDGGTAALLQRLGDPAARARIALELGARMPGEVDPAGIVVAAVPAGCDTAVIGRSIAELAAAAGSAPADTVLDVLAAARATVGIVNHSMAEADLLAILADPFVAVASDGAILRATPEPGSATLPHPRSFGTFTRFLGEFVRDRQVVGLPEAIRRITSLPASRVGLFGRGVVRRGAVADLAVFDPDVIGDRSTYADPWGGPVGVEHVLVGGAVAVRDGALTGVRAGRVLRRTTDPTFS